MEIPDKFSYDNMVNLSSLQLNPLLIELRELIEATISARQEALPQVSQVKNIGARDNKFIAEKALRQAFYDECEQIAHELNRLGHRLLPIDTDLVTDFDFSNISWSNSDRGNPNGLELTFYPKRTELSWCLSAYYSKKLTRN